MNFSVPDSVLGRPRCRQWTPLFTQQLRVRHLYQIMAYNVTSSSNGSFYYTLHSTTMCAPFYTSERSDSINPKWAELDLNGCLNKASAAFVLRIWQTDEEEDKVIFTWGVNLSGLVYLGGKLSEVQPTSFIENSVIFHVRGGYFTSYNCLRKDLLKPLPFIDNLNIISNEFETLIYKNSIIKCPNSEIKTSYPIVKLQKVHSSQFTTKNKNLDVAYLREKIITKCGLCSSVVRPVLEEEQTVLQKNPSQLLTMTSLNKMLNGKTTTIYQKQRMFELLKDIERAKFKTKLLAHEKDKLSVSLRKLEITHSVLVEENEERGSVLMENYHQLSRDKEKLKEFYKEQQHQKESLYDTNVQLNYRRRQLMNELLFIYPIVKISDTKYLINEVYLPDSKNLSDCSDGGLAVALGYVAHALLMTSWFLQVPLRYPIKYFGSRSHIYDHIAPNLSDKDREFPLYPKGKDRMQFNYAVYLLNKNLAQLRWLCGQYTPDLHATLPNLLSLLQRNESKEYLRSTSSGNKSQKTVNNPDDISYPSRSLISDPPKTSSIAWSMPDTKTSFKTIRKKNEASSSESRPGLNDILMIPEAYLNRQISDSTFKSYLLNDQIKKPVDNINVQVNLNKEAKTPVFEAENVEQGTDILNSSLNITHDSPNCFEATDEIVEEHPKSVKLTHDNKDEVVTTSNSKEVVVTKETNETGVIDSDKIENSNLDLLSNNEIDSQKEFLQKWLDSGPALVCSEESLYPEEILGTTVTVIDDTITTTVITTTSTTSTLLTSRTDALLNTTSFNLIKPK